MNLDESLITSEVCVSCGRCCLFEEWKDTLDQRDQIQNGIHVCTPEEEYGSDPKSWVPIKKIEFDGRTWIGCCLLYTSPSPRDQRGSRMPSSA